MSRFSTKLRTEIILIGFSFLFSPLAFSFQANIQDPEPNTLRLGVPGVYYFNPNSPSSPGQRIDYLGLDVWYKGHYSSDELQAGLDVEGFQGFGEASKLRFVNVPEIYLGSSDANNWQLIFGRKVEEWNSLDDYWSMGLYQPRYRWDYLNEKQDGIFGFFLHFKDDANTSEFTAFASPIFIPEQGAPFDINGGNCKSTSPWFNCPGTSILLFNEPTALNLNLHIPPIRSILAHPGGGLTYRIGNPNSGPWARASWAYKPMNQILLAYVGVLDFSKLAIPADIYARVLYHEIYSAEAGAVEGDTSVTLTGISEHPKYDTPHVDWNYQRVRNAVILGGVVKQNILGTGATSTHIDFSAIHINGGNNSDLGPFSVAGSGIFEPRYDYTTAYSLALVGPVVDAWKDHFNLNIRYIVTPRNDDNVLMSDAFYKVSSKVTLNLGMDLFGSNGPDSADFYSHFQHNSRARGGVYYVF